MQSAKQSLIEFPCDFPIKVMGKSHPFFADTILTLLKQFDAGFDKNRMEIRASQGGNYLGLTCTVHATDREHLDNIYRALTSHPMVSVVL